MDPAGLFAMWPGWRIVAPSTPFDYVGLMNSALRCEDPVLVIEHVALYGTTGPGPLADLDYCIPLGKAKVVKPGAAFTVLTYLAMVPLAVRAAADMGVDAEVIDLRSLDRAGIDWGTIEASRVRSPPPTARCWSTRCSAAVSTISTSRSRASTAASPRRRCPGCWSAPRSSASRRSRRASRA
jgi:pyruvate/2-oxoglutarate/acetoin dehydrogenase E1 component